MIPPRISVIVPSFNQGRFLGECLESIVGQRYPNLELIVMDGGSTDESVSIIERYAGSITYWQSEADGGQSAAINAGVARATGQIVAWLNSDDIYCAEALWTVGRAFEQHPHCGLYIGNGFRLDEKTGAKIPFARRRVALNRRALREGVDFILQPATFFNRAAWVDVGGLDPDLHYCMDWDILIRIADRYPAVLINEFLAQSREYEETKTSSGGMKRVAEICEMAARHTGQNMTAGAACYLLDTMMQPGMSGHLGPAFHRLMAMAQVQATSRLASISETHDGFPDNSDPQDVTFGTVPNVVAPPRSRNPLRRLWGKRPRGLLYSATTALLVSLVAIGVVSETEAMKRLHARRGL